MTVTGSLRCNFADRPQNKDCNGIVIILPVLPPNSTLVPNFTSQPQISYIATQHPSALTDLPADNVLLTDQFLTAQTRTPTSRPSSPIVPPQRIPQQPISPSPPLPGSTFEPFNLEPLQPTTPEEIPEEVLEEVPERITVKRFEVENSNDGEELKFDPALLAEVTRLAVIDQLPPQTAEDPEDCPDVEATNSPVDRELTFAEILKARSAITAYYVCRGYTTSGAIIPEQTSRDGVVRILVVEGRLEDDGIVIEGTRRLRPAYVRDRLALAATTPLNVDQLLEGLRLLQIDPLIRSVSADLQTGTRPGTNRLVVKVQESDTFSVLPSIDNNRSPSVGSFRRQIQVNQANLLGFGDGLSVSYANTDGSNQVDASYAIPVNPRNGAVRLAFGLSNSQVIEPPFDVLNIESTSSYYELSFRQPVIRSFTALRSTQAGESRSRFQELALGIAASHQESQAEYSPSGSKTLAFPSLGADLEGRTRISALRFFQDWTQQGNNYVLAARSQFSLGLEVLDATVNEVGPDSRFLAWRGQGQWVRQLAPNTLLLVRGDLQLADAPLLPQEQFSLGGQDTIRGYRQDFLLTDNGALLSAEVRVPVRRLGREGVIQLAPFVDVGTGWNSRGPNPDPNLLASVGLGLLWRQSQDLTLRLDWGLPLVQDDSRNRTWQESGFYFSVVYTPF